jgi:hypothetical protein
MNKGLEDLQKSLAMGFNSNYPKKSPKLRLESLETNLTTFKICKRRIKDKIVRGKHIRQYKTYQVYSDGIKKLFVEKPFIYEELALPKKRTLYRNKSTKLWNELLKKKQ